MVLLGFWMDGLGSVAVGGVSVGLEPGSEVASLRAKGTGGLHDGGSEDSKRGSFGPDHSPAHASLDSS